MRTRCTVERVECSPLLVTGDRPYSLQSPASIMVWLTRTYTDGRTERAMLEICLQEGFRTDGASTFWPISRIVPPWRVHDDRYNAGPVAHDVLYILEGHVASDYEPVDLSREEVDDILRGMWRCWGMSRFLAGCADKAIELIAGGREHWGSDSLDSRQHVQATWHTLEDKGD